MADPCDANRTTVPAATAVLFALENGPATGLQIALRLGTHGCRIFSRYAIHAALRGLEHAGLIALSWGPSTTKGGRRPLKAALTQQGAARVAADKAVLSIFVRGIAASTVTT